MAPPPATSSEGIGKVLSALQPSIGRLHDANSQNAELMAIMTDLGYIVRVKSMRGALVKALRENNILDRYQPDYVFTKRAREIFEPEFLHDIGFKDAAPQEQGKRSSDQDPPVAHQAGMIDAPARQTPVKLKLPGSKAPRIVLESPASASSPTSYSPKPAEKRPLEASNAEPPPKRPKIADGLPQAMSRKVAAQDNQAPSPSSLNWLSAARARTPVNQVAGKSESHPFLPVSSAPKRRQPDSDSNGEALAPENERRRKSADRSSAAAQDTNSNVGQSNTIPSFSSLAPFQPGEPGAEPKARRAVHTAIATEDQQSQGTISSQTFGQTTQQEPESVETRLIETSARCKELEQRLSSAQEQIRSLKAQKNEAQAASMTSGQATQQLPKTEDLRKANENLNLRLKKEQDQCRYYMNQFLRHASLRSANIPTELRIAGRNFDQTQNDRMSTSGMVYEGMLDLYQDVKRIPLQYALARNMLGSEATVQLSMNTTTATASQQDKLETLYKHVFGTADWKRRWLEIQFFPEIKHFRGENFMASLIGAGIYEAVLSRDTPWNLVARAKNSLSGIYDSIEAIRAEVRIEENLKLAQYAMYHEGKLDNEISAHARALCNDLADTLLPQLELWKAEHVRQGGSIGEPKLPTNWINQLESVIRKALKVKVQQETFDNSRYEASTLEFVWLSSGDEADKDDVMSTIDIFSDYSQRIQYTIWPGVKEVLKGHLLDGETKGQDQIVLRPPVRVVSVDIQPNAENIVSGEPQK